MSKLRKAQKKQSKQIEQELNIPVEGFYNYYAVPWDMNLYVKFPVSAIVIGFKDTKLAFKSSFEYESPENDFVKARDRFMGDNYLGSARETDTFRLKSIIGMRKELKTE